MPKDIITAPAVRPSRRGLLANATPVDAGGGAATMPRWVLGFTWETAVACGGVLGPVAIHCLPESGDKGAGAAADDGTTSPTFRPYALLGVDRCRSAMDRSRDRVALATANLRATASWQAEVEFWSGAIGTTDGGLNFNIADDATPVAAGLGYVAAVAELEAQFADCAKGVRGMLHVTPKVASLLDDAGLLRMDGDRLVTVNDNVVVVGAGYADAAGSDDVAAITHQVHALLGPVVEFGGSPAARIDRATNDEITFVEQPAALFADTCCAFVATGIDMTASGIASVSLGDIEIGEVSLSPGDLEIGAVEIKNASTDDRALVDDDVPSAEAFGLATREVPTTGVVTQPADIVVDATAGGVVLLAVNAARKSAAIQNTGAEPMRVRIDGDPAVGRGIQLAAGQTMNLTMPFCPTGAIKAIRQGAVSTTAAVLEVV